MRKELNLELDAKIHVQIMAPSEKEVELLSKEEKFIAEEVRATKINIFTKGEVKGELVREWNIEGLKFLIGIERAEGA